MQIRQATVVHSTSPEHSSNVEIHDLSLDSQSATTRFRFPLRQSLVITQGQDPSYAAQILVDGQLVSQFSETNWTIGQLTFRTKKPETTKVVTIYRDQQFPNC